jgi:hypothetical protein
VLIRANESESSHLFHEDAGIRGWDGLLGYGYGEERQYMEKVNLCGVL